MTTVGFYERKRMNPRALTVVILLHGAALTALVLAKTEVVRNPFVPTKVFPVDEVKPPPEKPKPQPKLEPVQEHVTTTTPKIDLPPIDPPPLPPPPTFPGGTSLTGLSDGPIAEPPPPLPSPPPPPPPHIEPARAKANLASYVSDSDYPSIAIRAEEQGTTRFRLAVGPDGKVSDCIVTGSSGSSALDQATCRIMKARARFTPARDGAGRPTGDTVANAIRWVLPDG
ncbi:MAG: energy transducer TonB [Alphaproteobacteria bacterium]|nr:energy transducer TonB [Alphaproteobacteria bacterium]MBV9370624.1 energy transducer TonB [Alphaproteobacteria bacterium]MBV9899870.1 energy transducer TonB [Alphaproteobacteria bacterium]